MRTSLKRSTATAFHFEGLEQRRLLTTYYVSPSGLDSNAGTSVAPFLTLQAAANAVGAGDTVVARAGTYAAGFVLGWDAPTAGTANAPITFEADPVAAPGTVIISGRTKVPSGIDLEDGCDWIVIKGFTINNALGQVTGAGIRVSGSNNVSVLDNTVDHCGGFGIFSSFATNLLIQGNTVTNTIGGTGTTGHGIYVSNSAVNPVVRNNIISNNNNQGLQFNGDASMGGSGLVTGALVENNIIRNSGSNGMNCDGLQNSRIQNNIIYNNNSNGICLFKIDGADGSKNNVIVNNTIYAPSSIGAAVRIKDGSTGNKVYNNILIGNTASIRISNDSLTGLFSDYNAVINKFTNEDSGVTQTLAQWQSGHDTHSFIATAAQLFVNAAGNDFHLSASSPAVDTGTNIASPNQAPTSDADGNSRPNAGFFDIGAFETSHVDTTLPTVTGKTPAASTTNVPISSVITVTFSEPIQSNTLSLVLKNGSNVTLPASISYDSISYTATLTPTSYLSPSSSYTVVVSSAKDLAGNTMAGSVSWSFSTAVADSTKPALSSKTPASGATSIATNSIITIVFSEPIQSQTLSFVLKDAGNNAVTCTVQYDGATKTATLTPAGSLAFATTYSVIVSGAKDLAGNVMNTATWGFTTAPLGAGPFNIFGSTVPAVVNDDDNSASEVGMKFRTDVSGYITGVRFYKGPLNTGTHVGHLWDINGNLLGTVTFSGESSSGWQQASFSSPIAISANTTYVISYFAPHGQYAENDGYFTTSGADSAPLHALASGVDGVNGVYTYTPTGAFPTDTYQNANYWVDVVFSPTADVTAPTISNISASSITSSSASITWTTNETSDTQVEFGTTTAYGSSTTLNASLLTSHTAGLSGLLAGTLYHYRVLSRDASGNLAICADFTFTTAPAPAPSGNGVLGGNLYNDLNGDGVKNGKDSNLANWQLYIDQNNNGKLDIGEVSVRTNANGVYLFTGLIGGTYRIREVIHSGFRLSNPLINSFRQATIDSSSLVTNLNFANTQTVLFGGVIFQDLNGNGLRDAKDPGLSGWMLYIDTNNNGKLDSGEKSVLTDSAGQFTFVGNAGTNYVLRVVQKAKYQVTTGKSLCWVNMAAGTTRTTLRFGEKLVA